MKQLHFCCLLPRLSMNRIYARALSHSIRAQGATQRSRTSRSFHCMPKMNVGASMTSSPSPNPGYFQKINLNHPSPPEDITSITITDTIYGTHTINSQDEPLLVALLQSPYLTRLGGVNQHGITGLLGLTPQINRLEHSIGAFLIVRSLGASLPEQAAALLHDVSHTALSHVVDWALASPGEGSYHEVHKPRYLAQSDLPGIVRQFARRPSSGFTGQAAEEKEEDYTHVFEEERFPLVEYPAPHLCADRIDYALRDAVAFGKLSLEEAMEVFNSFRAYPDTTSPDRLILLADESLAIKFARVYNAIDRDVWSNPANIAMYQSAGKIIGDAVRSGKLEEDDLWRLSDKDFWEALRQATDDKGREVMGKLESEGLRRAEEEVKGLPVGTKIRTLDPDVLVGAEGAEKGYQALSKVCPEWGAERSEYISARKRLMEMGAAARDDSDRNP